MAENLTPQQQMAVENRGGRLLVSAAAGSGKTKVLVDRLLSYVMDSKQPANLDDFLIITYTKAAAAELRGKIAAKLTEKIAADPENRHLQKQMQRLYLAKISTVHSFCADILREYAYMLDISADFRVADESECEELQNRVLQQLLDSAYTEDEMDSAFCAFLDNQGFGRDDRQIPEIIRKTYNSAKCHLDPNGWLEWCLESLEVKDASDASDTVWGKYLIDDLKSYLNMHLCAMEKCVSLASSVPEMEKPALLLSSTVDQLRILANSSTWDAIYKNSDIDYGKLTFSKKCKEIELIERIKTVRDSCKKGVAKKLRKFSVDSRQIICDMVSCADAARGLVSLTKKFSASYDMCKRSRHILDFGDLEQKTLDLLLGKTRSGVTAIAREIGNRYREVMVDEYQDSNAVQDAIFTALTEARKDCFMVGDVKQSIYQFRLADPGIFLKKYNDYLPAEDVVGHEGRKVLLNRNFRSSGGVISAVNDVFETCMSPEVGGLVYGEEELLVEGVPHIPLQEPEVVLYGIEIEQDTYREEASFVADKIATLLNGTHLVRNGDHLRPVRPEDVVILLRSPGSVGGEFSFALEQRGIRCTMGGTASLLASEEIETLRSLLQVISNPLHDIPLVAVLTSRVFGFTANDMARIRGNCLKGSIYEALHADNSDKTKEFLVTLNTLRKDAQMNGLSGLLMKIFNTTRIDSIFASMEDGKNRLENLQSFCQIAGAYENASAGGLNRFLDHIASLEEKGLAAPGKQGTTGAVTIMSIHKSKGLEFPVVFLCGMSRAFNAESARAQVLCDSTLGLGLSCVDVKNRVRYPSLAKNAISAKILADELSEEMRVLYVAMTRARDRLIMTYAVNDLDSELDSLSRRMDMTSTQQLARDADCPGFWLLLTALKHKENGWSVQRVTAPSQVMTVSVDEYTKMISVPNDTVNKMRNTLSFRYLYTSATTTPSKQTATQLKGRNKDHEVAENAVDALQNRSIQVVHSERQMSAGKSYGTLLHSVMQHISYEACTDKDAVLAELSRLVDEQYISNEQRNMIEPDHIADFFMTEIGRKLQSSRNVLREFKFSILEDAMIYYPDVKDEKILLQGVVDCAIIDTDGIYVIDFKSDRVSEETVYAVAERYCPQVIAYAQALAKIYQLPVKSAQLYFFRLGKTISVI